MPPPSQAANPSPAEEMPRALSEEDMKGSGDGATSDVARRLVLTLFLTAELLLIGAALWPTCWLAMRYSSWATTPARWVLLILAAILVFNYAYLLALLALRLLIPRPPEGLFPRRPDGRPPREATVFMLNMMLTKARLHTPWAALFSSLLVHLFPFSIVYPRIFGPRTRSHMGDVALILDPYYLEAGKDVTIGAGATITCHIFDHRGLFIKRVRIGDCAVIGGRSIILPGVEVGHHAVVGSQSLVKQNTIIRPYEFWAGIPARRIRDIRTPQAPAEGTTEADALDA